MGQHKKPRNFELRIYTLASKASLDFLKEKILPRNVISYPAFGIEPQGIWTNPKDTGFKLYFLVSYAGDQDPKEVEHKWLSSKEFAENTKDLDPKSILSVEVTYLQPTESSPLQ